MDSNCYILLWNLKSPSAMKLTAGVSIRPLTEALSVFDLAAVGSVGFREWASIEPVASSCFAEIESAKDADTLLGYDTLNRAWLVTALLVLRGCGKVLSLAVSAYSWSEIAGFKRRTSDLFRIQMDEEGVDSAVNNPRIKLPRFSGGLLDYRLKFLVCPSISRNEISLEDATWIEANFEKFNLLAASSEKFRFALEASVDWRYAHDSRSAIARLWSGIESLFGISAELVYRISISAASLLRERGEERIAYADKIKKLYGVRSKAVHGDKIDAEKLAQGLDDSFILLRDLLFLIAERGRDLSESDMQAAIMK